MQSMSKLPESSPSLIEQTPQGVRHRLYRPNVGACRRMNRRLPLKGDDVPPKFFGRELRNSRQQEEAEYPPALIDFSTWRHASSVFSVWTSENVKMASVLFECAVLFR